MIAVADRHRSARAPGNRRARGRWVRFLRKSDLHAFAVELVDTVRAADSVGNSASVAQLLIAWQHTAEVYSDPELLAALTRDHGEDYGPVRR
ncbi:hypothetical protein [Streptomyces shenzhenensis]|uniref:hypothetical protein n=1 Tax=Streptomyces shenzhenensis TaxID=943815 RepID=UPI00215DB0F1|nr:hypothetical protein [Streptomyces shenzhenensis]